MKEDDPLLTPPEGIPRHTDEIDEKLQKNLKLAHRTRWVLVVAVFTLLVGAVVAQTILLLNQQNELNSSCQVWRTLSPQTVTVNPVTRQPTRLSVAIIAASRAAYNGQHCGTLPPADPVVIHWAHVFNIPLAL